jgi:hypothetical protein
MGKMVIAAYQPKPGKEADLLRLLREHLPILWKQGLATERKPLVMKAADGTFLEVFEWQSEAAVEAAHANPVVLAMWDRFQQACEFRKLGDLAEAQEMFPHFEPLEP